MIICALCFLYIQMPCKTSVFVAVISAVCVCLQTRYRKPEKIVFSPHLLNLDGFKVRVHELNFSYAFYSLNYEQSKMVKNFYILIWCLKKYLFFFKIYYISYKSHQ
jgi:hypothetical protein